jgi:multidrug efflux system outer membrane protein
MSKVRPIPAFATVVAAVSAAALCLTGCTVGPNYHRPDAPTPASWKAEGPWRPGDPRDQIPKGEWWKIFGDADLSVLETQAVSANFTIQASVAKLDQARALARTSTAALYPQVGAGASAAGSRVSATRPQAVAPFSPVTQANYVIPSFTATWEPDFFGGIHRSIESAEATYQASAADLENVRLATSSELAADYFSLREIDTEIGVLNRTVESFQRGMQLVQQRFNGGVASGLDVAQEQTLLDATRAQSILLGQQRVQFEDAIATLTGQPASNFHIAVKPMPSALPAIPVGVPSDLLERRPDIAEAERQMASANALIGVATAAYYPGVNLGGSAGLNSTSLTNLASLPSAVWAVGAAISETLLTGGARRAQLEFAQAGYKVTIANYRGSVLTAFQEVEDNLAGLAVLDDASKAQAAAVADARKALEIANNRYVGGLVSYLDVVTAQQTLLSNERLASQLEGQRLTTSVLLVKALGGGWDAASIAALHVDHPLKQALQP